MSLPFLHLLSQYDGDTYINNPVEIGWLVTLKRQGLVDADIGPAALTLYPSRPPMYAITRGLTPAGYAALGMRPRRKVAWWRTFFGFQRRKFPMLKFRNCQTTPNW